ncbi:hypothetical protein [Actinoplanes xinjiangensis]|uniref:Uncharacterized protein n=1 Tax=Actinoplanes xinjiangensis TaxID=512350 RepID=A0A316EKI5_9ACTN|nr:hypothetical protein [Actinoplanes xinjiangensis]PWK31207.1 hypothetical protein BC793_13423 [Actinoplanes xinjiangensis]
MTPRPCTDGTLRHLSVALEDAPGEDGGSIGLTLCSAPGRPVWGHDQWAIDIAYDMHLTDTRVDITTLPACAECLRVAGLPAGPGTPPPPRG